MSAWVALPNARTVTRDSEADIEIREWEPGDGLTCSEAGKQKHHECTAPVAVFRTSFDGTYYSQRRVRQRVLCSRHVAEALRTFLGDASNTRNPVPLTVVAEKAARERVLAAHWDEYQAAIRERVQAEYDSLLSTVPESLRRFVTPDEVTS